MSPAAVIIAGVLIWAVLMVFLLAYLSTSKVAEEEERRVHEDRDWRCDSCGAESSEPLCGECALDIYLADLADRQRDERLSQ